MSGREISADRPPLPPRLDPRVGRPAGGHAGGSRGGRRIALVARVLAGLLSVVLVTGSGWGWYLIRVAEASVNRTDAIPTTGNSDVSGDTHAGQEMNMLLVGVDSRAGLTQEQIDEYSTGNPEGLHNTDTMMLVHIPADGSAASFVSFPRDMYVPIPGVGRDKLNAAYSYGYDSVDEGAGEDEKRAAGARLLIQTISGISGLQIDHYAEINLLGFINLTQIVGGVDVDLCESSDDSVTGAHFDAGPQTLSGAQALLFVRQRHGVGPRASDFDRVARQQVFIAGMLRNVLSSNTLLDPTKQQQIVQQVGSSVTLDNGLDIFQLAAQMQNVQPDQITFQTIPGLVSQTIDGISSLKLPPSQILTDFFADLTADPEPAPAADPSTPAPAVATVAPSAVTVSVLNGSGVSGAAAGAATELTAAGFRASSGGNADPTATTTIAHRTGDDAVAATLAAQVPGAAVVVDDTLGRGAVTLTLGSDFDGVGAVVQAPAAPTEEPAVPGAYVNPERTAADTSCIY